MARACGLITRAERRAAALELTSHRGRGTLGKLAGGPGQRAHHPNVCPFRRAKVHGIANEAGKVVRRAGLDRGEF